MTEQAPQRPTTIVRAVRADDAEALVALIGAAYDEHRGCVLDLADLDADLLAPTATAGRRGGRWWVAEVDGRVIGSIGTGPVRADGHLELKRLYLAADARGRGLASRLVTRVEAHAAGVGARAIDLWSDTRFAAAHTRYEALGYRATGETRELNDPSNTTEYRFTKALGPLTVTRAVVWDGPHGRDEAAMTALPDGAILRGSVGGTTYSVEVDVSWRTRRVHVATTAPAGGQHDLVLSSDGLGRWWRDGTDAPGLQGCTDVDIEVTPATNVLPIRRSVVSIGDRVDVTAAWLRVPDLDVGPVAQTYTRTGTRTWRYASASGAEAHLEVDGDGLVVTYDDLWHRCDADADESTAAETPS